MKALPIRLSDIPAEGVSLAFHCDPPLLDPLGEGVNLLEPVAVSLRITPQDDRYFIEGTVRGKVRIDCDRCAAPVTLAVNAPCALDAVPAPTGTESGESGGLGRGELDVMFVPGALLNMEDLVREQLLLQVPMRVLCREGCAGLCPRCRKNLNAGPCGCPATPDIDPRLEILKKVRRIPES
ncbi:MAG: YceD family protein [Nitrospirota bacterium]